MASFAIVDEEKLLIESYRQLEEEKISLERDLQALTAKENAKLNKLKEQCKDDNTKHKLMMELLNAFRLLGICVSEISESSVTLIFDTCYKDQYFEAYYLEVNTHDNSVIRHTMPYFIPCNALAQEHLPKNWNYFATAIRNHVGSYVRRRQQCLETKEKLDNYFAKPMEYSSAYDFVRMDLTFNLTNFITITINYQLDNDLPEKIVVFTHNVDMSLKSWCEETFGKYYLEIATEQLIDRLTAFS